MVPAEALRQRDCSGRQTPQIAELGGTSLPDIAQASSFLRSHGSAIIAPETRQAREWLEAIAGVDSQVGVVIPLHEHTIPEFPDTPNEIIGSLPSDVRRRLILEIRFSPTPAVVSNPAICGATTSHQCFRWALARFGEAGVNLPRLPICTSEAASLWGLACAFL